MLNKIFDLFKPVPDAELMLTEPEEIRQKYSYWRIRQLYSTFIGYGIFYFVRKNISLALPVMETTMGLNKAQLGLFLTLHNLLYGFSKFLNGILGDRANPRYFMVAGLFLSALMNIFFGLSTGLYTLGIIWMLNGWFQGMGFPPCARILSHWFSPKERGTKWAIWNTSHQTGGALILILSGYLAQNYGWKSCFFVPAAIALIVAIFLLERLRDTPGSLGLPPVEVYTEEEGTPDNIKKEQKIEDFKEFLIQYVFKNKSIWIMCFANFFVYIIRYAFMDWAPSFLNQTRNVELAHAGWMTAGYEIAGIAGSLIAGWMTDRYFKSRRGPVCVIYMILTLLSIFIFWMIPAGYAMVDTIILLSIGFFIYGPQFLLAVMTADIATKKAAATAIGLTGLFGYLSGIVSGWGLGLIVDKFGWDGGFLMLVTCAGISTILFAFTWNVIPTAD